MLVPQSLSSSVNSCGARDLVFLSRRQCPELKLSWFDILNG
jgi:hypothetical protein